MLSFLGITECSSVSYDDNITPGTAVLSVNSPASTTATHPVQQPQQRSVPTVGVRASTNSAHARATPVDSHQSSVVNRQGLRRPVNFREAVTAAVYADQKDKERRAKSVVVCGMVPRRDVDDRVSFLQLCASELSIDIRVVYARRLGVAGSSDRIRPLLVGLSSAEEASSLLSMAKSLRQLTDDTVRRSVYINRNLSATEARLAL